MAAGAYAAIFDLDGVLTSTSAWHEQSWREAAERFGFPVSAESLRATRSVPRAASLSALLAHAGVSMDRQTREAVMAFKNARYLDLIGKLGPPDAFPGVRDVLERCRRLGMQAAVASASLNAREVLDRLNLLDLVGYVADPREAAPKPSAEIYRRCCQALNIPYRNVACIEDGAAMIQNLRAEGMWTVGVGPTPLCADEQVSALAEWDVAATLDVLKAR